MTQNEFHHITDLFYKAQYGQGLPSVNRLLRDHPCNSNLYLNRGLFYSLLENEEEARKDISRALELNPHNYIAYFNLFSIHYRRGEDEQALNNISCSLSCLYLLKGKATKGMESVQRAIKYSFNNVEAHVLKGLLLMQQQKFLEAYCEFEEATIINPLDNLIFQLKSCAFQKAYPGKTEVKDYYCAQSYQNKSNRLNSSLRFQPQQLPHLIQQKILQFNTLYSQINGYIDAFTQKIPRNTSTSEVSAGSLREGYSKQKSVVVQDPGQRTPPQSEIRPEAGQVYLRQSRMSQNERSRLSAVWNKEQNQFRSIISARDNSHIEIEEDFQQFESLLQQNEANNCKPEGQTNADSEFGKLVDICRAQSVQKERSIVEKEQYSFKANLEECNLIYPLDDFMMLEIEILRLQLSQAVSGESDKWTDVYCILNYNSGRTKLATQTQPCDGSICRWEQKFEPIEIPPSPADLKIKVYNKKYNSFRDEYLGDIEVLITTAEMLKLPVFNKKGEEFGQLLIMLKLRDCSVADGREKLLLSD